MKKIRINKTTFIITCVALIVTCLSSMIGWVYVGELKSDINDSKIEIENLKNLLSSQYEETTNIVEKYETELAELKKNYESKGDSIQEPKVETELTIRDKIKNKATELGVDPILAVSISRLETGNWKSNLYTQNNNVGGMLGANGWLKYDSLDAGITAFVENLKYGYIDKGLTTIEQIGNKYCPVDTDQWVKLVKQIYKEEVA